MFVPRDLSPLAKLIGADSKRFLTLKRHSPSILHSNQIDPLENLNQDIQVLDQLDRVSVYMQYSEEK